MRLAGLATNSFRPLSLACQYLRPAKVGIQTEAAVVSLRRGRTNELLAVTLSQEGKVVTEAQVRGVDSAPGPVLEPSRSSLLENPLSFPLSADASRAAGLEPPRFLDQIEVRDSQGPTDACDHVSWWRLAPGVTFEDPWLECARIVLSMDTAASAILPRLGAWGSNRKELPWGFSNLDEMVQFHEPSATPWLHTETRILIGAAGYVSAMIQTWSEDGKLLATAVSHLAFFELRSDWAFSNKPTG